MCANWVHIVFYVVYLGHIFLKSVICYNINKFTYLLTYYPRLFSVS